MISRIVVDPNVVALLNVEIPQPSSESDRRSIDGLLYAILGVKP